MYKEALDSTDERLLALVRRWHQRGVLVLDEIAEGRLSEHLHQGDFEDAWDLVMAAVSQTELVTSQEREEALALLAPMWSNEFDMTPEAYLGRLLRWSEGDDEPYPYLT